MSDELSPRVSSQGVAKEVHAVHVFCDLCGLRAGENRHTENSLTFCCPGCRHVFLILASATGKLPHNFRESDVFRACVKAGVIPGNEDAAHTPVEIKGVNTSVAQLTLNLSLEGMWCPACAWVIEEVLRKMDGIAQCRVFFLTDKARIQYLPNRTSPAEIVSRINKIGYRASTGEKDARATRTLKDATLIRLGISSILAVNIMMLSYVLYYGLIRELTPRVVALFSYPMLVMSVPVVFYGGMPILKKAWAGICHGLISMDTLISVSALAAFFYSLLRMKQGSIHLYFDIAAMLITIVLLGRYIEMHAREKVLASLATEDTGLQKVRLKKGDREQWIRADALIPNDLFVVEDGERIPVDGRLARGRGLFDQSVLTGETRPTVKGPEEVVLAGSQLVSGTVEIIAVRPARLSYLGQVRELVTDALEHRSTSEELADSISRIFVPAIMGVAVTTALVLWGLGATSQRILLTCLSVLLVACPCVLGVAIPLVKVVATGLCRQRGIVVRSPGALERVKELDTLVLDKTGTVTEGRFALRKVVSPLIDEKEVLEMIAAIETNSTHFLAQEIIHHTLRSGFSVGQALNVKELEGLGVEGTVNGKRIFAGSRRLLLRYGIVLAPHLDREALSHEQDGMTVVFFGSEREAQGFLVFGDVLKQDAGLFVAWLKHKGTKVVLLSGDGNETTAAIARSLGIADFLGEALPAEKTEVIRTLKREGRKIGMVGDGVNDALALAEADVGVAMGSGQDITLEAADLIIPSGRLKAIADLFMFSRLSTRAVRQNLCFAFLYNIVAVPVAAAGLLNPLVAVMAMLLSSLTVIGNTLRLNRIGAVATEQLLSPETS
ncbi:MAG TPA: cation-translocating P-type ATPase [Syntrophorhabdaceae bacterium]|nr:cation-translocating P-type ATPase [Syntrophorhabdaceae bacterium]